MVIMRRIAERMGASSIFLLSVILVYIILGMAVPGALWPTLGVLRNLLGRVLPVLLLVFGIMFVTNLFLDARRAVRLLGRESALKGWALVIVGGIISSGPIYMWYPLLSDLKEQGMKNALIATFLYNRAIKIPLIPMMVYYFGWAFTVVLSIYMVLFSIINGVVVARLTDGQNHS